MYFDVTLLMSWIEGRQATVHCARIKSFNLQNVAGGLEVRKIAWFSLDLETMELDSVELNSVWQQAVYKVLGISSICRLLPKFKPNLTCDYMVFLRKSIRDYSVISICSHSEFWL